jgi:hypothetical protein
LAEQSYFRRNVTMKQLMSKEGESGLRTGLLMLVIVALISSAAFAAPADRKVNINVRDNNPNRIVIQYELGDFTQRAVSIGGQSFTEVYIGKESVKKDKGAPAIPDVSRSIIIPDDAQVAVQIIDSAYYEIENTAIAPSKGNILRNVNPADVPYTFGNVYQTDAFYPGPLATLREPYIMRDYRGITVTVNPFQYNPVRRVLRVYTDITVEISAVGKGGANILQRQRLNKKPSRAFREVYSSQFINYTAEALAASSLDEQGEMLIIAHDPWVSNLQPLVDHKNNIGINTTIVPVSTIGNNSTSIKNYIQNVYNTSDLAYVLLVGDATQVATPTASGGSSDPSYSKLAGSDNYPDIFVGRFSAESAADVDTQVLRTIEYEITPATQQNWFWRGIGIASPEGDSSTGDDGESDQQHIEGLRLQLLAYNYALVDQIYEAWGPTAADITNGLNAGRGVINYCGHGSNTAWGTTGFSVTNVNALTNHNMLPFIFDVACVNGNFNGLTCFAEAWMRATNSGEPTGAAGIYASSINQSWAPPMEAQDTFNSLYIAGTYNSYGALCYAGSCSMMDKYGSGGVDMFNTWHIFGDPSLRIVGTAAVVDNTIAHNPRPANKATGADLDIDLVWTPGIYAASHDVYFGTDYNSVSNADHSSGEYKGNQPLDNDSFDPGTLDYSTTYYWAIDEVNEANIWPGEVWRFTTAAPPPPPSVGILGSWVTGTSHAKESGSNRALVFIAHAERSSATTLNSVTYGGQSMTKVVDKIISSGTTRTYVAAFILNDAGITAAANTTFTPSWSAAPTSVVYDSVFLQNVNQATLTGATASNATSTGATITTSALATGNGDMVIDAATCSNTGSYTVNNGFTEAIEPSITSADAVVGYKSATGSNETPSVTHSTTTGRQSLIGFVVKNIPIQASNPNPANGATGVDLNADLSWTAGIGATSHDVYFGTSNPPAFQGNQTGATFEPGTLNYSTTYYWRIDEHNTGGTTLGTVWSFTTVPPPPPPPGQASNPTPADAATNVSLTQDLSWTAGSDAASHDVYFGTVNPPPFKVNQTATTYDTGTMTANTTYYWRIDEKNVSGTTAGEVWGFTTTSVLPPPMFVAAGAVASGTGAITPSFPSGIAAGDILLLFLETSNQAISVSNSNGGTWAAVTNSPQSTGTAAGSTGARLTAFWSRYNGTQGAPTTSDSGNHQLGRIIAIRGAAASGNPWDVTAGGVEATSDTSGSIPGTTTTVANTLVVAAIATSLPDSSTTTDFSSWTNSNLTGLTERTDNTTSSGNGGGLGIATGTKATAGAYGNTTVTLTSSAYKGMMSIAIKP